MNNWIKCSDRQPTNEECRKGVWVWAPSWDRAFCVSNRFEMLNALYWQPATIPEPPPKLADGHNPAGLTEEQVGIKDGWRLLREDEIKERGRTSFIQIWFADQWTEMNGCSGSLKLETYRTRLPYPIDEHLNPKPPTLKEKDEAAFKQWAEDIGFPELPLPNCNADAFLAGRASLREEVKAALKHYMGTVKGRLQYIVYGGDFEALRRLAGLEE